MKQNKLNRQIFIEIAGLIVCMQTDNQALAKRLQERYQQFLVAPAVPKLTITIQSAPDTIFVLPQPGEWVIDTALTGSVVTYQSYFEAGEFDLAAGQGWLRLNPKGEIENFLRVVYAWLCVENKALLLHAAGMIRHDDQLGYAFFGHSGAGKTTTTRLSEQIAQILSDDLVIIRVVDAGCHLYGVPFRGVYGDVPRANQSALLKGIFRLNQANHNQAKTLPRAIATAELAASVPFINDQPAAFGHMMDICGMILDNTPVAQLRFKQDPSFWQTIDDYFQNYSKIAPSNRRQGN